VPAKTFALEELAAFCGAWIERPARDGVQGLAFDSRKIRPGNLFVAVPGRPEPFFHDPLNDGHPYCADAARAGAAAVLVEKEVAVPNGTGVLLSDNVFEALRSIGLGARRAFGGRVVGVVGSCGKTTIKEFTAKVLSRRFKVSATEGNRNNILGVPEMLANADADADAWVVEMGISSPGEMDTLAAGVEPSCVIFSTVQPVHMEFFPSLEGIRDEKARVLAHLKPGGFIAVNADDPLVIGFPFPSWSRRMSYGLGEQADLRLRILGDVGPGGIPFGIEEGGHSARGMLPVAGLHQASNFAAACAAGRLLGMDIEEVAAAAVDLKPAPHRGEMLELKGGTLLMDDSYNANPSAVESVLRSVCHWGRRTVVALGEMRELGASSQEHHRRAGRLAAELGVQALLCVGEEGARALREEFSASGLPCVAVGRWQDGAQWIQDQIREGDTVLVKGSRAWGLDGLAAWLQKEMAP
jgi:UDP-N-acetylmuramoyl-tripeptide--D-alanyl-D-alanine ligase